MNEIEFRLERQYKEGLGPGLADSNIVEPRPGRLPVQATLADWVAFIDDSQLLNVVFVMPDLAVGEFDPQSVDPRRIAG